MGLNAVTIPAHREAPMPDKSGLFCTLCGFYSVPHRMHEWEIEWVDLAAKSGTDKAKVLICSNCESERSQLKYRYEQPDMDSAPDAPLSDQEITLMLSTGGITFKCDRKMKPFACVLLGNKKPRR